MAWLLSTGAKKALLSKNPSVGTTVIAATLSFGDGTGTGGRDQILDSGDGLGSFKVDDFILIIGGANNNVLARAVTAAAGVIEVAAGTLGTQAEGDTYALVNVSSGSFAQVFKNSVIYGKTGTRPVTADLAETGIDVIKITRNGATFVAGSPENGLNAGEFSGTTLQRSLDPVTGLPEVWRGIGLASNTLGYVVWYDNAVTTGASSSAIRMYGLAGTSGADVNLSTGLSIVTGVYSEVTSFNATMAGV